MVMVFVLCKGYKYNFSSRWVSAQHQGIRAVLLLVGVA